MTQNLDEKSLVTVASYWHDAEAWIAQNRLEAEGIRARVTNDQIVGMNWLFANAVGGVKVQVADDDADKATAVLSENRAQMLPSSPQNNTAFVVKKCRRCGSSELYRGVYWRRAVYFSWLILGFPLPIRRYYWMCWHCGYCEQSHPLQFSIRSLLILTFIVALALGIMRMTGQTWFTDISAADFNINR